LSPTNDVVATPIDKEEKTVLCFFCVVVFSASVSFSIAEMEQ